MNQMILKNYFVKASVVSMASMFSFSVLAADKNSKTWVDMSDPTAIYSNATIGGGTEGIDLSGTYGGYLTGVYKQRFTVAAMHDLDYLEVNYLLLNSASESGLIVNSTWDEDIRVDHVDYKDANDIKVGFFAKLGFFEKKLNFYPQVNIGYTWAKEMKDTTYVEFEATTRYTFNRMFWIGVTPTYAHGMKGEDLNEWTGTVDAGMQLSDVFGFTVSANDDKEFTGSVTFAF
ncbi:hypothetical protein N8878_08830 [Psychromonas sp.]|nr:hypothetical protein [Psychromonas sp.]